MQNRFLEIATRPQEPPQIATELRFGNEEMLLSQDLLILFDRAKIARWQKVLRPWQSNQYHFYDAFHAPTVHNRDGSLKGHMFIGRHLRDPNDFIFRYAITRRNENTWKIVESRGLRMSQEGLFTVDYIRDPNRELPIYKDQQGLKDVAFWRGMVRSAEQLLPII